MQLIGAKLKSRSCKPRGFSEEREVTMIVPGFGVLSRLTSVLSRRDLREEQRTWPCANHIRGAGKIANLVGERSSLGFLARDTT
jgi:hypothetical protein